jgi:hypothetical protein
MVNPARVDAKLRMLRAVAGSNVVSPRSFPPTPNAITKVIRTGSQATRSYQFRTVWPQKETRSDTIPMTTIPTLQMTEFRYPSGLGLMMKHLRPTKMLVGNTRKSLTTEYAIQYGEATHSDEVEDTAQQDAIISDE